MVDAVRTVKYGPVLGSIKIKRKILTLDKAHKYKAGHMSRSQIFLLVHQSQSAACFQLLPLQIL
jgi:hypothetical protein